MRIAVPKETFAGERRVALVPESCRKLIQAGYEIVVESAAGDAAGTQTERIGALGIVREKRREEADAAQHAEAMMRKYQDRDQPNIKREQDPWNRSVAAARRGERRRS